MSLHSPRLHTLHVYILSMSETRNVVIVVTVGEGLKKLCKDIKNYLYYFRIELVIQKKLVLLFELMLVD